MPLHASMSPKDGAQRNEASTENSASNIPPQRVITDNEYLTHWVNSNSITGDSSETGIATSLYQVCLRIFAKISRQYVTGHKASSIQETRIIDSYTRLCLWGDGLVIQEKLEICLALDEGTRDDVITVLHHLGETLLKAFDSEVSDIHELPRPNEALKTELEVLLERASAVISRPRFADDDDASDSSESERDANEEESLEISKLDAGGIWEALDGYIISLTDIRPTLDEMLRDVLVHPSNSKSAIRTFALEVTAAAQPYVLQVQDKFPRASISLAERLGEANWQRHLRLRGLQGAIKPAEDPVEAIEFEQPKSTFRPVSNFHDSALGSSLPSQSMYAASNASYTSFLSTESDFSKDRKRVPSMPTEGFEGTPFTCFICLTTITNIRNRVDWKLHVFADLQPYVCTMPQCDDVLTVYPTRKLWAEHDREKHRIEEAFKCYECSSVCSNDQKFIQHLYEVHHFTKLTHTQCLNTLAAAKRTGTKPMNETACPLCSQQDWKTHREYTTHLARHMEEISLSVLPLDVESDEEDRTDEESDDQSPRSADKGSLTPLRAALRSPQEAPLASGADGMTLERKKRQRATTEQLAVLESEFSRNSKPDLAVRQRIASETNLPSPYIRTWFLSRRRRAVPAPRRQILFMQATESGQPPSRYLLYNTETAPQGSSNTITNFDPDGKIAICHFTCRSLKIGAWRRVAQNAIDLVIFYSPKHELITYYISNDSRGYKIEYPFKYIDDIRLETGNDKVPSGLVIELNQPPHFFMDTSGSENFYECGDFTEDQQASQVLVHHLGGHPKILGGQLSKLLALESFQSRLRFSGHNPSRPGSEIFPSTMGIALPALQPAGQFVEAPPTFSYAGPPSYVNDLALSPSSLRSEGQQQNYGYQQEQHRLRVQMLSQVQQVQQEQMSDPRSPNLIISPEKPEVSSTASDQKKTEFFIHEFRGQKENHTDLGKQLARQRPKEYVFANATPDDY